MKNFILITLATTAFSLIVYPVALASETQMEDHIPKHYQKKQQKFPQQQKQHRVLNLSNTANNGSEAGYTLMPFHKIYADSVCSFGLNTFNSLFDNGGMGNLWGEFIMSQTFQPVGFKFFYNSITLETIQSKVPKGLDMLYVTFERNQEIDAQQILDLLSFNSAQLNLEGGFFKQDMDFTEIFKHLNWDKITINFRHPYQNNPFLSNAETAKKVKYFEIWGKKDDPLSRQLPEDFGASSQLHGLELNGISPTQEELNLFKRVIAPFPLTSFSITLSDVKARDFPNFIQDGSLLTELEIDLADRNVSQQDAETFWKSFAKTTNLQSFSWQMKSESAAVLMPGLVDLMERNLGLLDIHIMNFYFTPGQARDLSKALQKLKNVRILDVVDFADLTPEDIKLFTPFFQQNESLEEFDWYFKTSAAKDSLLALRSEGNIQVDEILTSEKGIELEVALQLETDRTTLLLQSIASDKLKRLIIAEFCFTDNNLDILLSLCEKNKNLQYVGIEGSILINSQVVKIINALRNKSQEITIRFSNNSDINPDIITDIVNSLRHSKNNKEHTYLNVQFSNQGWDIASYTIGNNESTHSFNIKVSSNYNSPNLPWEYIDISKEKKYEEPADYVVIEVAEESSLKYQSQPQPHEIIETQGKANPAKQSNFILRWLGWGI